MANIRFVNSSLPQPGKPNYSPKFDYKDLPILTLEEAVKNVIHLVPDIADHVLTAKEKCEQTSTLLTPNESAALYLYTMPVVSFYSNVNNALRVGNRELLKPWLAFLKLFLTALEKLPSIKARVWRAVNSNAAANFVDDEIYTWWNISSCSMDLTVVESYLDLSGTQDPSGAQDPSRTIFAIETIHGKEITAFSANRDEKEVILMPGTSVHCRGQVRDFINRLFVIHLDEIYPHSESQLESNDIFDQIKQQYKRNSRIERFMDPSISYPIEQTYVNLSIVHTKEQWEKEKKLRHAQNVTAIIGSFEEIYGTKTSIDVKDIFNTCATIEKQVLVFGRAGIGKSTFCRYITYQWAMGSYWTHYELLALIPLRRLTAHRYPSDKTYSLIDLIKKEVFPLDLTQQEEEDLKKKFDVKKTLWILDGYDEIVHNVPPHLQYLFEQLLKTPHHIITSRPYLNTLSYDVQMEITGFTDGNIANYVENFFNQMNGELNDASLKGVQLLRFLRSNLSIWGVAHIPINLELICSLWSNEDCLVTEQLTMTRLYTTMTEWLCQRYSRPQNNQIRQLPEDEIYQCCQKELVFLESLAFNAMENNTILIRPALLITARNEAKISFQEHPHILNIGILKSFRKQGVGNQIEMNKDYYFVHLSFQEYFAARYLINLLKGSETEKARQFLKNQKYNRRYALVFSFAAGLLGDTDGKRWQNLFWDIILGEPLDLVGIRHMQLVISCIAETTDKLTFLRRSKLIEWIAQCLKFSFTREGKILREYSTRSLQGAQSVTCDQTILNVLIALLEHDDVKRKVDVLSCISKLQISNPSISLITTLTSRLNDENEQVRTNACSALGQIGKKAATNEVITQLVTALGDQSEDVRVNACSALEKIGEKAATNEVITKLVSALGDQSEYVRMYACLVLGQIGKKAATNEVITKLVTALGNQSSSVRMYACLALGQIGEKAATNEVITKLVTALGDQSEYVRMYACEALGKIGEKVATNEVITKLVTALGDQSEDVRMYACEALGNIGEKAATNEMITKLVTTLGDQSKYVQSNACEALGKIGKKAATNEVITKLVSALGDQSAYVRSNACLALGKIGEKAATNEVITKLVSALGDQSEDVRISACEALGKIGEKAATNEVITELVSALGDQSEYVRISACEALGKIGEKAATNEVITKLVSALGDQSKYVQSNACEALGKIGEKAATNEVITKLVSALGDQSEDARIYACEALGKIGEKAATNEVITKLVTALGDQSEYVRSNACSALGKISEKAATNEVITKLVSALGDQSYSVRISACSTLGKIGEKAATNEVITKLVSALEDQREYVRSTACIAVGKIGEKAATNEVITKLAALANSGWSPHSDKVVNAIASILSSSAVITQLDPMIITDLCLGENASFALRNISEDNFLKQVFSTENSDWLSFVTRLTLLKEWAVVAVGNNVILYGMKEPQEVFMCSSHLYQDLISAFIDQGEKLQLYFQKPQKLDTNH